MTIATRARLRSYLRRKVKYDSLSAEFSGQHLDRLVIGKATLEAMDTEKSKKHKSIFKIFPDFINVTVNSLPIYLSINPEFYGLGMITGPNFVAPFTENFTPIYTFRPDTPTPFEEIEVFLENISILEVFVFDERQHHGDNEVIMKQ